MNTKFYRPSCQPFMGSYGRYDKHSDPYLIEIAKNGEYRYVWSNKEGAWHPKRDKDHNRYIKNGTWLEVTELPEKPWKW